MKHMLLRAGALLIAVLLAVTAAAAEAAARTWDERMEEARAKYNKKTVNVYVRNYGNYKRGKINVCFYKLRKNPHMAINIRESLQITDEAEMEAILEVITENKNYEEEIYGTISFMKAQWIAHNMAHDMATGTEEQKQMIEMIMGESLKKIAASAKTLDLSPLDDIEDRQKTLYEAIDFLIQLAGN